MQHRVVVSWQAVQDPNQTRRRTGKALLYQALPHTIRNAAHKALLVTIISETILSLYLVHDLCKNNIQIMIELIEWGLTSGFASKGSHLGLLLLLLAILRGVAGGAAFPPITRGNTMASRLYGLGNFERVLQPLVYRQMVLRGCTSKSMSSATPANERMMDFEEYRKLKRALKWNARVAGIPMGFIAVGISSLTNLHFMPNAFDTSIPPEEIQPIL